MHRRLAAAAVTGAALMLGSCGTSTGPPPQPTPSLQAVIVSSEVLVGQHQRLPIGILDHNTPVTDATVHVRVFYLGNGGATQKGEFDAPFKGGGLNGAGVYVADPTFDVAGAWRVDVTALRPDGEHGVTSVPFTVVASAVVPAPGQPAPRTHNQTAADVPDVSYIDSGTPPDDMHQISIADAIAQHRPTLVIFASPAFCTSRICGPEVDVVKSLEPDYQGKLTFIHVEVYANIKPDPAKRTLAQPVIDWRLQSEPWVFLID
ncbi:MAG TPA: hypothetical protein VET65_01240, partial [Candidatus Limnocylindrales bacterium]|nr:hypothetical protein [Candidatus Limnocylindrales bacterium]